MDISFVLLVFGCFFFGWFSVMLWVLMLVMCSVCISSLESRLLCLLCKLLYSIIEFCGIFSEFC